MNDRWHPAPQSLIDAALSERFSKTAPAPDVVGFLAVFARLGTPSPWTARRLADWAGWSRWKASQTIQAAKDWKQQWTNSGHSSQQASGHQNPTTARPYEDKPATFRPDSGKKQPSRARITKTIQDSTCIDLPDGRSSVSEFENGLGSGVAVPSDAPGLAAPEPNAATPAKKADRLKYADLWAEMERIRLAHVPNARRVKMGKRHAEIRARVTEHGQAELLKAWRWVWESRHQRARFLRDGGYATYSTFFRAKNCRDYVGFSAEWDPNESTQSGGVDLFDLPAEAFDEAGNIIDFQQQPRNSNHGNG